MILNFWGKCKNIFIESINELKGSKRRIALAKISEAIGKGGQTVVAKGFKVSRDTVRKGLYELKSEITIVDNFNARGRKNIEEKLLGLLEDITDIVDSQSQTDPSFKTTRLFTRITVKEVRNQLIKQKNYEDADLPTNQTLNNKITKLGYKLKKVQKVKPLKKLEQTPVILLALARQVLYSYKVYRLRKHPQIEYLNQDRTCTIDRYHYK